MPQTMRFLSCLELWSPSLSGTWKLDKIGVFWEANLDVSSICCRRIPARFYPPSICHQTNSFQFPSS